MRPVMQFPRSGKNLVIIFQSRSLALLPQRSLLNLAVQQTQGLGLIWKFLIRTVSYTSHKLIYTKWTKMGSIGRSKRSRVDLPSFVFFLLRPQKSSTNQKLAPISCSEARCPARRMLVNARKWRNDASWSGVAYTTSGSKARSNARWRGRSLAFKTRWRMCFSYKSFTFICFHANFSSFSFVDRQNTYSCKSD